MKIFWLAYYVAIMTTALGAVVLTLLDVVAPMNQKTQTVVLLCVTGLLALIYYEREKSR